MKKKNKLAGFASGYNDESCTLIGYREQDGRQDVAIHRFCPLEMTRCVPQEKKGVLFPHNKSFIDRVWSIKNDWMLASFYILRV